MKASAPRWVTVFQSFYNDFPARFASNFQSSRSENAGTDRCPALWKAVGDELVFCGRVSNKRSVGVAVLSFINTMTDYRKALFDDGLELNLKGAGWLAAFPEPNRAVQLQRSDLISASEALERAADEKPFDYDFLGKAIDTGFRVAATAKPERFALSVQLARLLATAPRGVAFADELCIDQPISLKGVNRGLPYPVLYIETNEHMAASRLRQAERQILAEAPRPQREDLASYLTSYCEVAGTDEIVLPADAKDGSRRVPPSYEEYRPLIEEHLRQEQGREDNYLEGDSADGDEDMPVDELPIADDLEPLPDHS